MASNSRPEEVRGSRSKRLSPLFSFLHRKAAKKQSGPSALSLILPLYIYPAETAWESLYSTISLHHELRFSIIINPYNGPGPDAIPDPEYRENIAKLNKYENVQLLGYVHTTSATRDINEVKADISRYAQWAKHDGGDLQMDGIFFDESPNHHNREVFSYMSEVTGFARHQMTYGHNHIIINPGVVVDPAYYTIADSVLAFENCHAEYPSNLLSDLPKDLRCRSSVMIHNFNGSPQDQSRLVDSIIKEGFMGLYISTQADYDTWSNLWTDFCAAMAFAS